MEGPSSFDGSRGTPSRSKVLMRMCLLDKALSTKLATRMNHLSNGVDGLRQDCSGSTEEHQLLP